MKKFTCTHFIGGTGSSYVAARGKGLDSKYCFSFDELDYRDKFYKHNYDKELKQVDLSMELITPFSFDDFSYDKFKEYIKENKIEATDIQISIPCCKGLTTLNRISSSDNMNNVWILKAVEWFLAQENKVLIVENSRDLLESRGAILLNRIFEIVKKFGNDEYKVTCLKTSAFKHNSPQSRVRSVIFIYKCNKESVRVLQTLRTQYKTVDDVLTRPEEYSKNIPYHFQPQQRKIFNQFLDYITDLNLWDFFRGKAEEHLETRFTVLDHLLKSTPEENSELFKNYPYLQKYIVSNQERCIENNKKFYDKSPVFFIKYAKTINARNAFLLVHPRFKRYLTLRELMDIQGLPEDYGFNDKIIDIEKCRAIFRMVPIPMLNDFIDYAIDIITEENKITRIEACDSLAILQNNYQTNSKLEEFKVL